MNRLYVRDPFGGRPRLSPEGREFKNRCVDVVRRALTARAFQPLPAEVGWRVLILVWMEKLETKDWRTKGKGGRFVRRDVDGFLKVLIDGVYEALGIDDRAVIDLHPLKLDGLGDERVDILLEETSVEEEQPNATEIAQTINDRNGGLRASACDDPLTLRDLLLRAPRPEEIRRTVFDTWRWEIMSRLYAIFENVQAQVTCPARRMQIDSCDGCTDFMVINCLANAPRMKVRKGDEVVLAGLFDLEERKEGRHLAPTEGSGPKKEETKMAEQTMPELVNDLLIYLHNATVLKRKDMLAKALSGIYDILSGYRGEGQVEVQQFAKIAMVLHDLETNGLALPRDILYYKEMTLDTLPADVKEEINQCKSVFVYCTFRYNEVMRMHEAAATAPATSTDAAAAPAAGEEKAAKPAERPALAPPPAQSELQPEPEKRRRRKKAPDAAPDERQVPLIKDEKKEEEGPKVAEFAKAAPSPETGTGTLEDRVASLETRIERMKRNVLSLFQNMKTLEQKMKDLAGDDAPPSV